MKHSWTSSWTNLFCILSLFCATGVSQGPDQFQLQPLNTTVLQGSAVNFTATVQGSWQVMTWMVGDLLVLTIPVTGDIASSAQRFTAQFCTSGDPSCVIFTMSNVSREDEGLVVCTVLGAYGAKTAQLYVQKSGSVNITAANLRVNEDEEAEFQCVTSDWFPAPTISWALNGQLVDQSLYNTTHTLNGDFYNSTSVLKFQAVRNSTVECLATVETLANPQKSSVFLVVVPTPPDWTVLIAIVVSIGGFALLVLLIIGIYFCCKRRKEKQPSYEDDVRRVRTQSQRSAATEATRGRVNKGYVQDDQTSVSHSDHTDSGFSHANGSSYFEMPDVVNRNRAANVFVLSDSVDAARFQKHRHATTV